MFTLTETETDMETNKKWLVWNSVEVFILHWDTDAIGYCSHFLGLCLGIDLSLC